MLLSYKRMNQHATARTLITEGRKLFASKGFDGASVREITTRAKANLGAVTYHFGSKEALYHTVLEEVFDDLAMRVEAAAAGPGTPDTRLRAIVAAVFDFFRGAPDAPLLVIREIAKGGPPPMPTVPRVRRVFAAITGVIAEGQEAGTMRRIPPFLGAFTLMSQCVWFSVMGPRMPAMLNIQIAPATLSEQVADHIAEVVSRALAVEDSHA